MQGFRTYIVAAMVATFGALAAADWNTFLRDPKAGWTLIASSVIFAVMRSITTTPPGKS